jgi:hypothetical protein
MQPGSEENLIGVNIAQASDGCLIHQGCLDRSSLLGQKSPQEISGEALIQGINAQFDYRWPTVNLGCGQQVDVFEPYLAQSQAISVGEFQLQANVTGLAGEGRGEEQLAYHHQMDDQRVTTLEVEYQHLALPPHPYDSSTLHGFPELTDGELVLCLFKNSNLFHPPPDDLSPQFLFKDFHLRQFGHLELNLLSSRANSFHHQDAKTRSFLRGYSTLLCALVSLW